jgi:hypothetical protein
MVIKWMIFFIWCKMIPRRSNVINSKLSISKNKKDLMYASLLTHEKIALYRNSQTLLLYAILTLIFLKKIYFIVLLSEDIYHLLVLKTSDF